MDVNAVNRSIYQCRAYDERPVENETLETVFKLVRSCPSAQGLKDWQFVAVRDADTRQRLVNESIRRSFGCVAPVLIACCIDAGSDLTICGHPTYSVEIAVAIEHLSLAAASQGLTCCWVGHFDEAKVRSILGIPDRVRVVEVVAVGYPGQRENIESDSFSDEIVRYDHW